MDSEFDYGFVIIAAMIIIIGIICFRVVNAL